MRAKTEFGTKRVVKEDFFCLSIKFSSSACVFYIDGYSGQNPRWQPFNMRNDSMDKRSL
jgi:hypothetical protein